ncbi:MAG: FeS cluster assembly protein SufD [Bacteroidia bacterium]|nr:FeS cluster assembly protein SufD [Bacteroidia bacterium]
MTTVEKISASEKLVSDFEAVKKTLPENSFVQNIRQKAIEAFAKLGIPARKNEEYKYSNVQKLFQEDFTQSAIYNPQFTIDKYLIPNLDAHIIVLVNDFYSEELSSLENLDKTVVVSSLKKAFEKYPELVEKHFSKHADISSDAFIALNTAYAADGIFIKVPDNTVVEKPIHIINVISAKENTLFSPRNLFVIGKNAQLQIVETFASIDLTVNVISNSVTEIVVGENARVQYYRVQNENENSQHINTVSASQEKNSHFDTNTVTLSGGWVRNNLNIALNGENCETHLNGLFLANATNYVDNHTLVDHRMPHCESNQTYKGILDGKATGVFNGKIFVQRDAQKTNAYQSSKNILLSDDATINAKPQLEIYADDVKCSHGSSTGKIDEDALFYLQARGLGIESAKKLLLHAFVNDVMQTIRIEALREHLENLIHKKLD